MATGGAAAGPIHPVPTQRSGYRYFFYDKHHGRDKRAAHWDPTMSRDDEFGVFDTADLHDIWDDRGWLYGIGRDAQGDIRFLGTWKQQIAEFPRAREGELWHGYPLWPLKDEGPENRRGESLRPPKQAFRKMEAEGLLSKSERKRLEKGNHV